MTRKMIYRYQRPDGGYTVTPIKPDGNYDIRWRLIAEQGMAITNGEKTVIVIDVIQLNDCETWADCKLPDELKPIEIDESSQ